MSAAYGSSMATSSNLRYQIVAGLIEERGIEAMFHANPAAQSCPSSSAPATPFWGPCCGYAAACARGLAVHLATKSADPTDRACVRMCAPPPTPQVDYIRLLGLQKAGGSDH